MFRYLIDNEPKTIDQLIETAQFFNSTNVRMTSRPVQDSVDLLKNYGFDVRTNSRKGIQHEKNQRFYL